MLFLVLLLISCLSLDSIHTKDNESHFVELLNKFDDNNALNFKSDEIVAVIKRRSRALLDYADSVIYDGDFENQMGNINTENNSEETKGPIEEERTGARNLSVNPLENVTDEEELADSLRKSRNKNIKDIKKPPANIHINESSEEPFEKTHIEEKPSVQESFGNIRAEEEPHNVGSFESIHVEGSGESRSAKQIDEESMQNEDIKPIIDDGKRKSEEKPSNDDSPGKKSIKAEIEDFLENDLLVTHSAIDEYLEKIPGGENTVNNKSNNTEEAFDEHTIEDASKFSHNFSSTGARILNNQTIILENFFYDGLSPDAHFYLGKESLDFENTVLIEDENGGTKKLKSYRGVNITLKIDENAYDYDYLSVWCTLDKKLIGFVMFGDSVSSPYIIKTENRQRKIFEVPKFDIANVAPLKTLSELLNTSAGVSSGNLLVVNETSIYVPNFSLRDTLTRYVNFYVGVGEEPSDGGQLVPYKDNIVLPKMENENLLLELPEEVTVNDVDWLSVWSENEKLSLGHVMLHSVVKSSYVQIPGLSQTEKLNYNIHSGPIIIVDTKTIFITNLHYNGKAPDAHFWAGFGKDGPDENGHLLLDEKNSSQPLKSYSGEDIYLSLPSYVDVRRIDYVAIWSSSLRSSLGTSQLTGEEDFSFLKEGKGFYQFNEEGKYIARLPKCCPIHQVKTSKGCVNRITTTLPIRLYDGNQSFLDDEPMQNIIYEPYLHQPNCEFGMFRMDMSEEFYLLTVGLMILPDGDIITKDKFCYDISRIQIEEDVWSWNETMFMCFETEHPPEFLNTLIVSCIYISSFFLIITSVIFIVFKKARVERGTNVMGYTTMMSLSFCCLATARILHVSGEACTVLGFIYQFFLVSSFTWLLCLSCDIFYQVWWYEREYNKHRYKIFAGFAMGLPIAAVIISIFINQTVPSNYVKPTFGYEPCWLRSDKKVIFYYVPIGISIILNFVFITLTWFKIKKRQKNPRSNWRIRVKGIKNVFRSCYLILSIMTICWTAEILSYYFETNNGMWIAIDVIDSLQGVFVFLVFVMHDPVIQILKTQLQRGKKVETIDLYDVGTRPPSEHGVLLSKLQHAESVEDLCCVGDR